MSILRNFKSPSLPKCKIGVAFYDAQRKSTLVDIKDDSGNVIAHRKSSEVIRRPFSPLESVRTDTADMYSIEQMLEIGINNQLVTKPYFRHTLDDASSMFALLNRDGIVEPDKPFDHTTDITAVQSTELSTEQTTE